ncbi:MAG: hypothetical protein Q9207_005983 [Kuettlingeria erythrocarpa]
MPRPEILVHAGAPSRGSDDARYWKQAAGILGFECAEIHAVVPGSAHGSGTHQAELITASQQDPAQESVTSTDPAPRIHLTDAFTTWVTPPLNRPSPIVLIGRTPAPTFHGRTSTPAGDILVRRTPADHHRPRTAPSGLSSIGETPNLRRAPTYSWESSPSEIQDSQLAPPSQQDVDPTFERSSSPSPTHRPSPTAKRKRPVVEEELEEWTQPEDTSTPLLQDQPQGAPSSSPTADEAPTRSSPPPVPEPDLPQPYRRREVVAPRPKTSTDPFTTHLTVTLFRVAQKCPTIINAVRPFRPIGILERGHWRFAIPTAWDVAAKDKMWAYLERCIDGGQAGWAVWAVFEEGEDPSLAAGNKEAKQTGARVKVYCWGEVVAEVYALVVLATHRQVNKWGAQWIDAAGNVAVQMPTAP